jgi:hypothetical protein
VLASFLLVGCEDPVRDQRIRDLGDEDPSVPVGVDHRPGQPCVLCHSGDGPASDKPFVVGGTVYATSAAKAPGGAGLLVRFVDSGGSTPRVDVATSTSGNFYVTPDQWPDMTFPLKTAVFDAAQKPLQAMQTTIDREGSCNFCHDPFAPDTRRSIGAIYAGEGGTP